MSGWAAKVIDEDRLRVLRLLRLRGERDAAAHQRDLLRCDLSVEWRDHGRRSAQAVALEEQIKLAHDRWLVAVGEIRTLESESRSAA
jgi:hypothetical protein